MAPSNENRKAYSSCGTSPQLVTREGFSRPFPSSTVKDNVHTLQVNRFLLQVVDNQNPLDRESNPQPATTKFARLTTRPPVVCYPPSPRYLARQKNLPAERPSIERVSISPHSRSACHERPHRPWLDCSLSRRFLRPAMGYEAGRIRCWRGSNEKQKTGATISQRASLPVMECAMFSGAGPWHAQRNM